MAFHKRHINFEIVKDYLERGDLDTLFNADAFFFGDEVSYKVYMLYSEDLNESEIKLKLNNDGQYSKITSV